MRAERRWAGRGDGEGAEDAEEEEEEEEMHSDYPPPGETAESHTPTNDEG